MSWFVVQAVIRSAIFGGGQYVVDPGRSVLGARPRVPGLHKRVDRSQLELGCKESQGHAVWSFAVRFRASYVLVYHRTNPGIRVDAKEDDVHGVGGNWAEIHEQRVPKVRLVLSGGRLDRGVARNKM